MAKIKLIKKIQKALKEQKISGWLFYEFHNIDPIAIRILKLPPEKHYTRRWFYLLPASGNPVKLVHKIEKESLDSLPGGKILYAGWKELELNLKQILRNSKTVAMQYSPMNAIPYISKVDAGTIELVKKCKVKIISSCDLVQQFEAAWTQRQLKDHKKTALILKKLVDAAFKKIAETILENKKCGEYHVQQFIYKKMKQYGLYTDCPPIVAVNKNASNPHYFPSKEKHSIIKNGDLVLLDLWAKSKAPQSVYADITWMGYVGKSVPDKYNKIFEIVRDARSRGVGFIKEAIKSERTIHGYEVDKVVRKYIESKGYGKYFIHRTGHSIGEECHGNGANLDSLETRDERKIIPNTCFSIEPGIYLPEFGIRSEINVYVGNKEAIITAQPPQKSIVAIHYGGC